MILGNYPISSLNNISSVTSLLKTTFPLSSNREVTSSLISAQRSPLSCCQVCSRCSLFHQLPAVGGATITTADLAATNGLIHVVDKVQSWQLDDADDASTPHTEMFVCLQVLVPDRKLSEGLLATLALRPEFSLFRSYLIVRTLRHTHCAGSCQLWLWLRWLFVHFCVFCSGLQSDWRDRTGWRVQHLCSDRCGHHRSPQEHGSSCSGTVTDVKLSFTSWHAQHVTAFRQWTVKAAWIWSVLVHRTWTRLGTTWCPLGAC